MKKSLLELHPKRVDIIILIFASAIFLLIGFNLPILTVRKLWESNTYSILSGIQNLWKEEYYTLAFIIFFFSIIFPIAKLMSLSVVWFVRLRDEQRQKLIYFLELLGRWSMLDVFVAAIIIVWVKLGALADAKAEDGIYFFGASILLAMIVTSLQGALTRRYK
ncbi:MAG: paraquat-inducible protein A [Candidatus Omnitrophica bacterium]|nr:paraquat-inducible protein A [Candidatus Omnitrophota bacterium]